MPGHGVMNGVPRYYDDILKEEDPKMYEEMKELRNTFRREHKEEYEEGRLLAKHKCKKARLNLKGRML